MPISCTTFRDCPVMYSCTANYVCLHEPILPLQVFNGFVYFVLLPIMVSICNVGGLSSASLRLPILMGFLNWPLSQAGPFSTAIAAGASLANFILLLPKRHPVRDTTLIDFLLIFIQMPPVLLGMILGLLISKFTPLLYRDIILIIAFLSFCIFFFQKWRNYVPPPPKQDKGMAPIDMFVRQTISVRQTLRKSVKAQPVEIELTESKKDKYEDETFNTTGRKTVEDNFFESVEEGLELESRLLRNEISQLREGIEASHSGFHWKDIGVTFLLFIFFDSLLMLATGRFVEFGFCTWQFAVGITVYLALEIIYEVLMYRYVTSKMALYRRVGYQYEAKLDDKKTYLLIAFTAFFGGLFQGIAATGAGSSIVAVLLSFGYPPKVCSATSGYLGFFFSTAAIIHSILHNELTLLQFAWFFCISFVLGGFLTILLYWKIEKNPKGSGVLMILISAICLICVITVIPNIIQTAKFEGATGLLVASKDFCDYL